MDPLLLAYPGVVPADALTAIAYGIIKILAYGAMAVVFSGVLIVCLCDLFECRKWRQDHGRAEAWRLMP